MATIIDNRTHRRLRNRPRTVRERCPASTTGSGHWWLKLLTGGRKCWRCSKVER